MASIGEQIVAARKAKGMTQNALAKALNISRATISNYEGGRRLPDAEMLLKLSQALDHSFVDDREKGSEDEGPEALEMPEVPETPEMAEAPEEPEAPETQDAAEPDAPSAGAEAVPADDAPAPVEAAKSPLPRRRALILAAVALCVALALAIALRVMPRKAEPAEAGAVTKELFRQDNVNRDGQPYFNIDATLTTQKNDGIDMWLYTVTFHEMNGFPFSIDRVEIHTFVGDSVHSMQANRDNLAAQGLQTEIPAYGDWSVDGGLPVQDNVSGIGVALRGFGDGDEELSFVYFQPLSK